MKLLLASAALIALVAFAHLAAAEEEAVKVEVQPTKQDDGTEEEAAPLESRYGGGSWKGGRGGDNTDNSDDSDNDGKRGGGKRGGKRGGGRGRGGGSDNTDNSDDSDNNNGRGFGGRGRGGGRGFGRGRGGSDNTDNDSSANRNIITNQRVTNKVIPGRTSVLPTRTSFSKSTRVLASTRRNTFRQNSQSTVSQLNRVKQTNVHTHLAETVHRPLTVNTYKRHHHTQYVIRKQPYVTNVRVDQTRDRYQPAFKNVVVYTNSQAVSKQTLPTITRNRQRNERLRTIWEAKRNLGTRNIGSALNEGAANIAYGGGGRGGDSSNDRSGNKGGCNGAYC